MRRILTTGLSLASLAYAAMASAQTACQPAPNRAPTITVIVRAVHRRCRADGAHHGGGDRPRRRRARSITGLPRRSTLADATQAQTTWTAPQEEGSVALTVSADDGRGGIASDYVRIVIKRAPRIHAFDVSAPLAVSAAAARCERGTGKRPRSGQSGRGGAS